MCYVRYNNGDSDIRSQLIKSVRLPPNLDRPKFPNQPHFLQCSSNDFHEFLPLAKRILLESLAMLVVVVSNIKSSKVAVLVRHTLHSILYTSTTTTTISRENAKKFSEIRKHFALNLPTN